jgi:OOP family OmpA-OmpF porin
VISICRLSTRAMLPALVSATVSRPAVAQERVPLEPGLTIITAVESRTGDYESIKRLISADGEELRIRYSSRTPQPDGGELRAEVARTVRRSDLLEARRYRISFVEGDETLLPGTTALGASAAMLRDLKTRGQTEVTVINQPPGGVLGAVLGGLTGGGELQGTLQRVETDPEPLSLVVNDRMVSLPTIHARGRLSAGDHVRDADFWFLDDTTNPLALKFTLGSELSLGGGTLRVVRIELPVPDRIERALAGRDTAVVYGLYFEFARAEIRPESRPTLEEIARVMQRHPDWKLRVAGHTDSVGSATANLELSRRRAEAVREALGELGVGADRLVPAGYGAAAPKATNATLEGRASNRRVELTRM